MAVSCTMIGSVRRSERRHLSGNWVAYDQFWSSLLGGIPDTWNAKDPRSMR